MNKLVSTMVFVGILSVLFVLHSGSASIHTKLRYFETLTMADIVSRSKRSRADGRHVLRKEVSFRAFSRRFRLVLFPGSSVLAPDVKAATVDGQDRHSNFTIRHEDFFQGHLAENTNVKVRAHFEDGLLCASIHSPHDTYTVEPSWRHLPGKSDNSVIIYRASDVFRNKRKSRKVLSDPASFEDVVPGVSLRLIPATTSRNEMGDNPAASNGGQSKRARLRKRWFPSRRSRSRRTSPNEKKICPMLIVADYDFYIDMGRSDRLSTLMYITWILENLNERLMNTKWDEDLKGYGIQIKEFKIHTEYTDMQGHYNQKHDPWKENKLKAFAFNPPHSPHEFCLCHLFTASVLAQQGLKGMGYGASTDPEVTGGICSPPWPLNNSLNLNAGVTPTRYDEEGLMIMRTVEMITGDVIGINWGAERDDRANNNACWPSDENGGSYILSDILIPLFPNNMKFSPCSKRSIAAVLRSRAHFCFVESGTLPDPWFIQRDITDCVPDTTTYTSNRRTRVGGSAESDSGPFEKVKDFFTSNPVAAAAIISSIVLIPLAVYGGVRIKRWRDEAAEEESASDVESSGASSLTSREASDSGASETSSASGSSETSESGASETSESGTSGGSSESGASETSVSGASDTSESGSSGTSASTNSS